MAEKENWTIETMEQKLGETDQEENFYLTVHRSSLYEDAAVAIRSSENIIQKNLLVEFVDEQAMDHGGVRKEFFFLLFQHIFDPDQQKDFNLYPESQLFWFPEHMASHPRNYAIIGFLMGLALYNGVIEQFNFPLAFYKKLLNVKVTFEDLEELDPILAKFNSLN
ncbi:putative E3 ubiquitin-protein ligase HERC4 [Thelohanellus kitauei]|uniref:HECT-type E3 ubiquitin transferase n=1 Tax=Thelohanellus kitauei TaxID=669202 RepID=A0A0C2JTL8_THEKT|nr:putative E3 ubiquitin-protein ligase HERC4 [Thelohanellus kitauei]